MPVGLLKRDLWRLGLDISSFGELKEVFELFEEDDQFYLPVSLIEDSEHPQIKDILRVSRMLQEFYNRLSNINALSQDELDEAYDNAENSEYWSYSEEKPIESELNVLEQTYVFLFSIQLSLFHYAYMLSNATSELHDIDFDPWNEQPELLAPMDLADQNVTFIFNLMKEVREVFWGFEV